MSFISLRIAVVIALAACSLVIPASAQTRMLSLHGDSGGDNFGVSVAGLGDLNGDGFADFAVGAPYDLVHGTVRICSGFDGATLATWSGTGSTPGLADNFGYSVGGGGDVNGDGTPDVVVGAPQYSFSPPIGAGYVRVLSGANGAVLHTFTGTSPGDTFGFSVDLAGDVNGDGYCDVIVGAATYTTVYSGLTGLPIFSAPYGGSAVARAGDVTGDGFSDVVIGSELTSTARIYMGPTGFQFVSVTAGAPFGGFGFSVAGAGDTNGDGFADVVVGAPYSGNGLAVVFTGWGAVINSFNGDSPNDRFGWSVGAAGNVDGTGFDEIVVGAPYDTNAGSGSGSARVCVVPSGSTLFTVNGDSPNDLFGWSVARAGHVNADNRSDFLVGAYGDGGGFTGSAYVISGASLTSASAIPLGSGCGAGPGIPALGANPPVLGSSLTIALAGAAPSASGVLVADFGAPVVQPLGGGCTAFPNLANSANWFILPIATNGAGAWQLPVTLSASHVFAGAPVTMQVAVVPTAGPLGLDLSNGLALVLGY